MGLASVCWARSMTMRFAMIMWSGYRLSWFAMRIMASGRLGMSRLASSVMVMALLN
jgi:hypothetical protein